MSAKGLPHIYIVAIELKSDFFPELVAGKIADDEKRQERFKIIPFNEEGVDKKFLAFRLLLRVTFQTAEKEDVIANMVYGKSKDALVNHLGLAYQIFSPRKNLRFQFERVKEIHERKPYPDD